MSKSCAGCQLPILDRFLMHVLDKSWHSACVQCQDCSSPLSDKCFSRDSKLYCRDDFYRRFGTKCGGCAMGISPDDLVRKAKDKVFHLECFTCIMCRKQLSTGEQLYVVDDNRFLCKDDFIASRYCGSEDDVDLEQHILDRLDDTLSEEKAALCSGKLSPLGGSLPDDDSRTSTPHLGLHMGYNCGPLLAPPLLDGSSPCSSSTKTSPVAGMLPELSSCNNLGMNASIKGELDQISASQNGMLMNGMSDQCGVDASDLELDLDDPKDVDGKDGGAGAKRRGPRTTIKAKQLETLKSAFSATPKPTRHIREQLAQETGLNMRVIQVWFQNRRSKERRMKQLSALGARRHFFRNPRRMRAMGREDMVQDPSLPPEMMQGPPGTFNYFDNEFYGNAYPGSFPGPMPGHDFYAGPLCPPGGAPPVLHPVSGISSQGHSAAFMSSPPGALSAVATGNRMSAILPTSGAASLTTPSQLAPPLGLPPPGHPHPPMTPVDVLPPTPGQLTPDAILSLTGGEPLPPMTSNDASPPSNGSCAALPTSLASTMAPGNPISCGPTSGQPLLGHQLLVQPQLQMTGHSQLGAAVVNGFPGEMAVGDGSW